MVPRFAPTMTLISPVGQGRLHKLYQIGGEDDDEIQLTKVSKGRCSDYVGGKAL